MCLSVQSEMVNLWDQKSSFTSIRSLNGRHLNSVEYQHLAMLTLRVLFEFIYITASEVPYGETLSLE